MNWTHIFSGVARIPKWEGEFRQFLAWKSWRVKKGRRLKYSLNSAVWRVFLGLILPPTPSITLAGFGRILRPVPIRLGDRPFSNVWILKFKIWQHPRTERSVFFWMLTLALPVPGFFRTIFCSRRHYPRLSQPSLMDSTFKILLNWYLIFLIFPI